MKHVPVVVGSMVLIGAVMAADIELRAQELDSPPPSCLDGEQGKSRGTHYFMEDAASPQHVDYSMLAVAPRDDRHYFIQSPPLPDLRDRLCDLDWLHEFVPDRPTERFDFGR